MKTSDTPRYYFGYENSLFIGQDGENDIYLWFQWHDGRGGDLEGYYSNLFLFVDREVFRGSHCEQQLLTYEFFQNPQSEKFIEVIESRGCERYKNVFFLSPKRIKELLSKSGYKKLLIKETRQRIWEDSEVMIVKSEDEAKEEASKTSCVVSIDSVEEMDWNLSDVFKMPHFTSKKRLSEYSIYGY